MTIETKDKAERACHKIESESKEKSDSHDTEIIAQKYKSKGAALINAVLSENMAIHADIANKQTSE